MSAQAGSKWPSSRSRSQTLSISRQPLCNAGQIQRGKEAEVETERLFVAKESKFAYFKPASCAALIAPQRSSPAKHFNRIGLAAIAIPLQVVGHVWSPQAGLESRLDCGLAKLCSENVNMWRAMAESRLNKEHTEEALRTRS